jgi:glycosidase
MKSLLGLLAAITMSFNTFAAGLQHVEPPNWWVGMQDSRLQLMLHGEGLAQAQVTLHPHAGVRLVGSHAPTGQQASRNYLFVDLDISAQAQPGELQLSLRRPGAEALSLRYALKARAPGSATRQGFGPRDAIYLVVPDRFARGQTHWQLPAGVSEGYNRAESGGRHGGDLAGLRQHLDYIASMGFTQLWPTPLVENNSPKYSYHGYAATDFYAVDPRFGSNSDYLGLVTDARARGIGVIQDIVLNHIGSHHWWMADLPNADWVNRWPADAAPGGAPAASSDKYVETHHYRMSIQDLYAAPSDRRRFTDGWFSHGMPDLNQRQPELATYLTQMTVWWVEAAGLSGLRTDTYSYSDKAFLTAWSARLLREYPKLNIVGEEWSPHPAVVAYWQRGKRNHDGYVSSTPSVMDFPLYGALLASLTEPDAHNTGFTKLYEALAHDFVYADPAQLVLFDGNHDTPRLLTALQGDLGLTRMALAYLATTRRVPQFTYGTELLMTSPAERDDGKIRADVPGGWAGDTSSAFTGAGLPTEVRDMQAWLKQLLNWRKTATAVHEGRLMQYAPMDGCYVFFRYTDKQKLMVVLNKNATPARLDVARFSDMLAGQKRGRNVMTGEALDLGSAVQVPARSPLILEVMP